MAGELKVSTPEMISALNRRYPQNQGKWANVVEFQNIDFLSVACWQSMDYIVHGHEIKVSRSDWLREIKSPHKSLTTKRMCDMWWLAAPKGIAKEEEIPEDWGFLEWNGYSFWMAKKAPLLRPKFPKNSLITGDEHGEFTRPIVNHHHYARKSFAMMARRLAYAQADADAMLEGLDEPRPYLDKAAMATGRATAEIRQVQAEWNKKLRERRRRP